MFRIAAAVVLALTLIGTGTARAQSGPSSSGDGTSQAFVEIMQAILQILESSGKNGSATSDLRRMTSGQALRAGDVNNVLNAVEREAGDDQFLRDFIKQLRSQMAASALPVTAALAPPRTPSAQRTSNSAVPAGRDRWECGVQTTCVGEARAELPMNGMAQLRLVSSQGNVVAYMNVYWSGLGPVNAIKHRELTLTVGLGSSSECKFTSDMAFYVNGRIQTFLGGVGTGPEVPSMTYRKVTRTFYIPDGATVTVGPGMAYCTK